MRLETIPLKNSFLSLTTVLLNLLPLLPIDASRVDFFSHCTSPYIHWIVGFGSSAQTLELEDGSQWSIAGEDRYILNTWKRNDPVILNSNPDWFAYGEYYLVNQNTQTRLSANLYTAPLLFGPKSHWMIGVDYLSGHITLENGTQWCVHEEDRLTLGEWEINDHLILGTYRSPFCSCDHILINAELNMQIRAHAY